MPANRFPLKGSSGSPIIANINGNATLIGILSGAGKTTCAECWDNAHVVQTSAAYKNCQLDCFRAISNYILIVNDSFESGDSRHSKGSWPRNINRNLWTARIFEIVSKKSSFRCRYCSTYKLVQTIFRIGIYTARKEW